MNCNPTICTNDDFDSQNYVHEKETYSIENYISLLKRKRQPKKIYDKHHNEIIFCGGKKIKPYFRRLNPDYSSNGMKEWHVNWQKRFDKFIEKRYQRENMHRKFRRTDVDLNDHYNIEFQYSPITKIEVDERTHDYGLCNKQIIWIVHGGDSVCVVKSDETTVTLHIKKSWKYQSFTKYDKIYLDVDDKIYPLVPEKVKSEMVTVGLPIDKDLFCEQLKNPAELPNLLISQANMYVKQQGAGNGKTYGIIQLLQHKDFKHYETFIYLTKQHSAVHVIYNEFINQLKREKTDDGDIISKLSHIKDIKEDNTVPKKHIITFTDTETRAKRKIIIATFDSFIWVMGNKYSNGINKFQQMVQSIIDDELRCAKNGDIKYAGGVRLNKKLLLVGDEMQDMHEKYMEAIMKIMNNRYVDFYAVGDKLQSISIENNAFTYLMSHDSTDIINMHKPNPKNFCRRFNHPQLIKFVNAMIPFGEHCLPEFQNDVHVYDENALDIFEGKPIYGKQDDESKVHKEVAVIMEKYIHEVENVKDCEGNKRKPNSFLIVTPFVNNNPLAEALNDSIREYWRKKYPSTKYTKYSVFHKSSDGTPIDLSESDDCTRIVSIHSSKGDGRDVVFVLGFTEEGLKIYSKRSENLIYDSLLHVGLTRMKEKMYFRVEANGDHIHRKIQEYQLTNNDIHDVLPILKISAKIQLSDLLRNSGSCDEMFNSCHERIIKLSSYNNVYGPPSQDDDGVPKYENKELIDYKHHCIRYAVLKMLLVTKIMNDNVNNSDRSYQQLYQILKHTYDPKIFNNTKDYHNFLFKPKDERRGCMPILKCGGSDEHFDTILGCVNKIRGKLNAYMKNKEKLVFDTPIESICLHYMMETCDKGKYSALPVSDMYDIVDVYKKTESDTEKFKTNISDHHDKIKKVDRIYKKCNEKYANLLWLVDHTVQLNGKNDSLRIYKKFPLIGYNNKNVLVCYIKPQFTQINYNEIMMDSIFDTYLMLNLKKDEYTDKTTNYSKFAGKKLLTCVFTLDFDEPYYFDWRKDNKYITDEKFIRDAIKKSVYDIFKSSHSSMYLFYTYWASKCKSRDPIKIVAYVRNMYDKNQNKYPPNFIFPGYINDFFGQMEDKLDDDNESLQKYSNRDYFEKELNKKAMRFIDRFFGK